MFIRAQPYTCLGIEWLSRGGVVHYFSCLPKGPTRMPTPDTCLGIECNTLFPCNSVLNGPQPQLQQGSVPPDWRLETYYRKFITYDCGRSPRAATQRALPSDRFNIAICHRACTRWRRCFRSASLFGSWLGLTSVDTRVQDPACGTSCSGRTLGRGSTAASWMLIEPCCRALALLIVRCSHRHSYRQRRQPSELVEDDVEACAHNLHACSRGSCAVRFTLKYRRIRSQRSGLSSLFRAAIAD